MNFLIIFLFTMTSAVPKTMFGPPDISAVHFHSSADDTTVSAYDVPPKPTTKTPPTYPASALKEKAEGEVILMVTISETGTVTDVAVKKGSREDLNDAAMESARSWVFEPAKLDGKPVKAIVAIPFRFRLDGNEGSKSKQEEPSKGTTPKLISNVGPKYPDEAIQKQLEGTVHVEMTVDQDGNVLQARVIRSAHPLLDEAALIATRQWKFEPSGREKSTVVAPVKFKLSKDK